MYKLSTAEGCQDGGPGHVDSTEEDNKEGCGVKKNTQRAIMYREATLPVLVSIPGMVTESYKEGFLLEYKEDLFLSNRVIIL